MAHGTYVKICPKCMKPGLRFGREFWSAAGITPARYQCSSCGYNGTVALELPISKLKEFAKKGVSKRAAKKKKT
ncbi:hypothetical protein HYV81_04775 [Candidatus Woesearchaeota archaeon]|nr:hypothetical protein [Candidatus Woesearchaeota archaeon]